VAPKKKLPESAINSLLEHLNTTLYSTAAAITDYVSKTFCVTYTASGIRGLLHSSDYSYKKAKGIPAKADPEKQAEFVEKYEKLKRTLPEDQPMLFLDGVHPTMETQLSSGWIRRGFEFLIPTTASRKRINLIGAINLEDMSLTVADYKTLNSESMEDFFKQIKAKYPKAPKIHIILDQGRYNTSAHTRAAAKKYNIELHHLPPYSPNLNPIERLWKLMNELVRNNRFFTSEKEFRKVILRFFQEEWDKIKMGYVDRINDNFEII
jgi:transposase